MRLEAWCSSWSLNFPCLVIMCSFTSKKKSFFFLLKHHYVPIHLNVPGIPQGARINNSMQFMLSNGFPNQSQDAYTGSIQQCKKLLQFTSPICQSLTHPSSGVNVDISSYLKPSLICPWTNHFPSSVVTMTLFTHCNHIIYNYSYWMEAGWDLMFVFTLLWGFRVSYSAPNTGDTQILNDGRRERGRLGWEECRRKDR